MGAHGIEILANTHIENYPYPTNEWVDKWLRLCDKYEIVPVEYGNWIDSHVLGDRDLTTEESYEMLARDIRLAHRLGFKVMRTKKPVISNELAPVKNWREIIKMALPLAEELDIKMCPEIHTPINLKGQMVTENEFRDPLYTPNAPEDIIPLLPYIYCCHAKFINMSDDFEETTIPYKEIIRILKEHDWDGYLLSEYEGADKYDFGYEVGQTLRKQHIMLKNEIGD